jgi:hypothetical protein
MPQSRQLKPEALQMIDNLAKTDWFAHVGELIVDPNIVQIHSWKEALKYCRSRYCANVQMEGKNLLTERLCFEHPERYHKVWNQTVEIVKEQIKPMIDCKTQDVIKANRLPKAFRGTVDWDILCVCMELEYADLIPPRFFVERAKWYLAGHFPCGWEGDFPVGGKLVVF